MSLVQPCTDNTLTIKRHPRYPTRSGVSGCNIAKKKYKNSKMDKTLAKLDGTKVVTDKVIISYARVYEPEADDKGVLKYSCCILIDKTDKGTLSACHEAIRKAAELGKAKLGKTTIPANLAGIKQPMRDGDTERDTAEHPEYAGRYFFNCSTVRKPVIVDQARKVNDTPDLVYSGCTVQVSVNFYTHKFSGGGVAVGLNNILLVEQGERLGATASTVEDDFGVSSKPEAVSDFGFGANEPDPLGGIADDEIPF